MSNNKQLISKDIKFDPNATPWQWTDNEDQVIEKGAQVRVKLLGIRSDVGAMYAIGSIKEDYLGQVDSDLLVLFISADFGSEFHPLRLHDH